MPTVRTNQVWARGVIEVVSPPPPITSWVDRCGVGDSASAAGLCARAAPGTLATVLDAVSAGSGARGTVTEPGFTMDLAVVDGSEG